MDQPHVPEVPGFTVEALLGVGGSAQVWRARPSDGGAAVALKIMTLADGAAIVAAQAEAALLAALDHPHLLRLQALVSVTADPVRCPTIGLVLDLAAGGSLADLLGRRERLTPGEVVTALSPVATALAYAHDQGLVHADVTPANVLFTAGGAPLLADLGVARVLGGYGDVHTTAAYADPAVAAGGRPGPPTDVFMLAATAVHALTGAPPWTDPLPAAALARAAAGQIEGVLATLGAVPAAMVKVLSQALCAQPHLRPSAAAFALDLRRSVDPTPVELTAGRRAPGRPPFDRPAWAGQALPTGRRATHVVPAASRVAEAPTPRRRGLRTVTRLDPDGAVLPCARRARPAGRPVQGPRHAVSSGRQPTTRRPRRAGVIAVVSAAAISALGWALAGTPATTVAGPVSTAPGPTPAGAGSWAVLLDQLDGRRAQAFAARNPQALTQVYPLGPLLAQDQRELLAVVPEGCSLVGARTSYTQVRQVSRKGAAITLHAVASLAPSTLRCPTRPAASVAGRAPTALQITLTAHDSDYRISGQQLG